MELNGIRRCHLNDVEALDVLDKITKSEKMDNHEKLYFIQSFLMGWSDIESLEKMI